MLQRRLFWRRQASAPQNHGLRSAVMLPPTAIAFDLDGTLIDSRGDIVAAVNHALSRTKRTPLPAPVLIRFIGDGARSLCARAAQLPEASDEVTELYDRFIAYYLD